MSRTQYAIKNAGFGILSKCLNLIFAFISRTVFIYTLGTTYLGVSSLFTEILAFLSFAELGFGSAMTFTMYKPVADDDTEKVIKLLDFYRKGYRLIALIIAILGLCLLPFLSYIVQGADWLSNIDLMIYFLIYLFNTVVSYFVSYKYTYLNALQKNYVQINIDAVITTVSYVVQILVLFIFENFLIYLCANSLILLMSRVGIVVYLDRKYPILKLKPGIPLSKEEKRPIYNEMKGLAVHQFASVAVHSTDNILISSMISVVTVGLVSNYTMLINAVLGFVTILFNSVTAGFGNLVASSTEANYRKIFKEINFINFWIYGFCCIAFWILLPPFITLWIGADKLIDSAALALIIANCYFQGQSTAYHTARIAKGNFNKDKWWAILQAMVNLVVSVICAHKFGLVGIYIGTVVSRMVYVICRPYSTYKFLYGESCVHYYKKLVFYFLQVMIAAAITSVMTSKILVTISISSFIMASVVVVVVPNCLFLLFNFRTKEFLAFKTRLLNIVRRQF